MADNIASGNASKSGISGDDEFSGTEVIIVEGFAKFRDLKRVRLPIFTGSFFDK